MSNRTCRAWKTPTNIGPTPSTSRHSSGERILGNAGWTTLERLALARSEFWRVILFKREEQVALVLALHWRKPEPSIVCHAQLTPTVNYIIMYFLRDSILQQEDQKCFQSAKQPKS